MARIRSIKPQFCSSEAIVKLSIPCRLHFVMLWTYADDEGRGIDNPLLIKAACWPLDEEVGTAEISDWQQELEAKGRLIRYGAEDGRRYFAIVNFPEHQKPQKPTPSSYPEPPHSAHGGLQEPYGSPPVGLPSVVVGEGRGVVAGKGAERSGTATRPAANPQVRDRLLAEAVELLLLRLGKDQLARSKANPAGWLESARRGMAEEHRARLGELLAARPSLTAMEAADALVPPAATGRIAEYEPEGIGTGAKPDMTKVRAAAAKARQRKATA